MDEDITKAANEMVQVMFECGFTVNKQTRQDLIEFLIRRTKIPATSTPHSN